jgi:glutamate 5-kinase
MKVVVKVGTQSILTSTGMPLESRIQDLVEQIVTLKEKGHKVALVSSGAVASGRKSAREVLGQELGDTIAEKQLLASLGQHELMHVYFKMLAKHKMLAAQMLLVKHDFHMKKNYLNIQRLLYEILEHKDILPIINENDTTAVEELMFTDNDELAGLIAEQIDADKLIILSNVDGVFEGHPNKKGSKLIGVIDPKDGWPKVSSAKSAGGRGGMVSKLATARKASQHGITTHIANIAEPDVVIRLVKGEKLGTVILPEKGKS